MNVENTLENMGAPTTGERSLPDTTCTSMPAKLSLSERKSGDSNRGIICGPDTKSRINNEDLRAKGKRDPKPDEKVRKSTVHKTKKGVLDFEVAMATSVGTLTQTVSRDFASITLNKKNLEGFKQDLIDFIKENRNPIDKGAFIHVSPSSYNKAMAELLKYYTLGQFRGGSKIIDTTDILSLYKSGDIHGVVSEKWLLILYLGTLEIQVPSTKSDLIIGSIGELLSSRRDMLTILVGDINSRMNTRLINEIKKNFSYVITKEC